MITAAQLILALLARIMRTAHRGRPSRRPAVPNPIALVGAALIVTALLGLAHGLRRTLRDTDQADAGYLTPHTAWIDEHDLARQVEGAVAQAYRDYDHYRAGEVR